MLRLSKKVLFAIEAVLDIACHGNGAVQSRDITRRQCIPQRYLEQALQELVRQGILVGVRGPRGGYRLAREAAHISVGDIVRVVDKGEITEDLLDGTGGSALGRNVVRPLWSDVRNDVMTQLDDVSIDALCAEADALGVTRDGAQDVARDVARDVSGGHG